MATEEPHRPSAAELSEDPAEVTGANVSAQPTESTSTGILPAQHWAEQEQPEAGTSSGRADSAIALANDGHSSDTEAIASSILQYRTIQGRSYHSKLGKAQYWASNDEAQNAIMDINHHIMTLGLGGKLQLAPLETINVESALDVGTGTGIWAIDFADANPDAHVIGTDVSPIQPCWIPPNLRFEIEDCTCEWTFGPGSFDYIHMRWLVGSIPDWVELFTQAFQCCKPGGWVESHETSSIITSDDGSVREDSAMRQWGKFFIEGAKKVGSSFTVVEDGTQRAAMEAAGFVDIHEFEFKCPIGGWPKDPVLREMGRYTGYGMETDSEGFVLFMAHTLGWTKPEIQVFIAHLRREVRSGAHHAYYRQKVVWGRKPA